MGALCSKRQPYRPPVAGYKSEFSSAHREDQYGDDQYGRDSVQANIAAGNSENIRQPGALDVDDIVPQLKQNRKGSSSNIARTLEEEGISNAEVAQKAIEMDGEILSGVAGSGTVGGVLEQSKILSNKTDGEIAFETEVLQGKKKKVSQKVQQKAMERIRKGSEKRMSKDLKKAVEQAQQGNSTGYLEVETPVGIDPEAKNEFKDQLEQTALEQELEKQKMRTSIGRAATDSKHTKKSKRGRGGSINVPKMKSEAVKREAQEVGFEEAMKAKLEASKRKRAEEEQQEQAAKVAAEEAEKAAQEAAVQELQRAAEKANAEQEAAAVAAAAAKDKEQEERLQAARKRQEEMSQDHVAPWLAGARQ